MKNEKLESWKEYYSAQVYLMAMEGLTEKIMAKLFGVDLKTFQNWKETKPEFLKALKDGSVKAIMNITENFFLNCQDRYVEDEEIRVYNGEVIKTPVKRFIQGDKWAQARWLALNNPMKWSEIQKEDITKAETKKLFKISTIDERYVFYVVADSYADAENKLISFNEENEKTKTDPYFKYLKIVKIECISNDKFLIL